MSKGNEGSRTAWLKEMLFGQLGLPDWITWKLLMFIVVLLFIYITNSLDSERQSKRISDLTNEVKELQYEQISTQSDLMNLSKQSEVLRRVKAENLGLEELTEPPRIIR